MPKTIDLAATAEEMVGFRQSAQTLELASVDAQGFPQASYSPFAEVDGKFYILVSEISPHTANLVEGKKASAMIIDDVSTTEIVYARRRLIYQTTIQSVDKAGNLGKVVLEVMRHKFGKIIEVLSAMEDFLLLELTPGSGRFVKGFGQAFDVTGLDEVELVHLTDGHKDGHR